MKRDPESQLTLDLGEVDSSPRKRRSRRRRFPDMSRRSRAPKRVTDRPEDGALLQNPETVTCGLCGSKLTVLEDASTCPSCGSIVGRSWEDD